MSIAANLERIRNEVADACARSHRSTPDVAIMAVSKMHPADAVLEAHAAGQCLFGENRVQEMQEKHATVAALDAIEFHLIGSLQSNKIVKAADLFHAIDTLDSLKTATRLNTAAAALNKTVPVLIEVKLSHEETKHGLSPTELTAMLEALTALAHLEPRGLMTVPPWSDDPETARPYFQQLRRLRDENAARFPSLAQLSMGMSNDFRVAIEEGSTCVRIGTAIFGKRTYA